MTNANETQITIHLLTQPGCRPCEVLKYVLREEADTLKVEGATVIEHDVTVERDLIEKYGIQGTPVLVFERNGIEMARLSGMVNIREIYDAIEFSRVAR